MCTVRRIKRLDVDGLDVGPIVVGILGAAIVTGFPCGVGGVTGVIDSVLAAGWGAASFSSPGLDPLAARDGGDGESGDRVGPSPTGGCYTHREPLRMARSHGVASATPRARCATPPRAAKVLRGVGLAVAGRC